MTPGWVLDALAAAVRTVAAELGSGVLARDADALVRDGVRLAAHVVEAVDLTDDPARLAALAEAGVALPPGTETTAARRIEARGLRLLDDLVRGAATIALAWRAGRIDYDDRRAAVAMRDRVAGLIDARVPDAGDATHTALRDLRAAAAARIAEIAPHLADARALDVEAPTPSLVLAYDLYGDADRGTEIATRNRLPRPGWTHGAIEVLSR